MTTMKMQKTFQIMSKLGYDYVSPVVTTKRGNTFGDVTHHTFEKNGQQIVLNAEHGVYHISSFTTENLLDEIIAYAIELRFTTEQIKNFGKVDKLFSLFDYFSA